MKLLVEVVTTILNIITYCGRMI